MEPAMACDVDTPAVTRSTAEIRLIFHAVRRKQSTLGRLRALTTAPVRTLVLDMPVPSAPRPHERVTSWRQLIGDRQR